MSERIDVDALQRTVNIVEVIGKFISLNKKGTEYFGLCPFHNDSSASLQINESKQIYNCFACGAGGDVLDFLQRRGATFFEAVGILKGDDMKMTGETQQRVAKLTAAPQWRQIMPMSPALSIVHYEYGKPAFTWTYRNEKGKVVGYVCRFNLPDGSKQVVPYVYAEKEGKQEWRWLGFSNPRPLYNLDKITANPDKMVMIVEGEKTANAAEKLFPSVIVTCWIGGAEAIHKTDWAPLFGRKIIVWPDNDLKQAYGKNHAKAGEIKPWEEQPGNAAMIEIEGILKEKTPRFLWISNDSNFPDKWDVADADWTSEQANEYVRTHNYTRGETPPTTTQGPKQAAPAKVDKSAAKKEEPPQQPPTPKEPKVVNTEFSLHDQPFKFLGFDKSETGGLRFHFFVKGSRTVVSLSHTGLGKPGLMSLAPLNFWENNFPGKQGLDLDGAQQYIFFYGTRRPFTDKNIRGRGAWMEGKTVVLHAGEHLVINGTDTPLNGHESKYIYEVADAIGFATDNPLEKHDSSRLMDVLKLMNWERPINPYLFAGWVVIAPICGALKWRPHIWLTGGAGVGKTWIFKEIVKPLLGSSALRVQSETTEAGIRQILGHDALPVVFDEAESNEKKDSDRIQTILSLVRASSAEDSGFMAKGSAGGTAKTYRIRSCFAFASIGVGVSLQSDRSRVSVIGLIADRNVERAATNWKKLQALQVEVITEEFCERLRARTIKLLPTIIENTRTFSAAVAAELGEQRAGDQLGALLAGAYSLISDKVINYPEACEWVASKDWSEERQSDILRDENRLLTMLMETTLTLDAAGSRYDRTVGELIEIAAGKKQSSPGFPELIEPDKAADRLRRFGIKIEGDSVFVSNTSDQIRQRLQNTPWSKNHNKILQRLNNAIHTEPIRFGPGILSRAVKLSLVSILGTTPAAAHPLVSPDRGGSTDGDDPTPF